MRYIKEAPFLDLKGEQLTLPGAPDEKGKPTKVEYTAGSILATVLGFYQPNQKAALLLGEIRLLNKAIDIFEAKPFKDGYFWLDEKPWEVAKKALESVAPLLAGPLTRLSPSIMDILENAETKEPQEPSPNGTVAEKALVEAR